MCQTTTGSSSQNATMTPPPGGLPGMAGPMDAAISAAQPGSTPDQGQPQNVSVTTPKPTKFGRTLELLTMGGYDPTGGADTGKFQDADVSGGSKPTKFGALLNVLRPVLAGGAIGGFEGKSTPQGGFGAAQNYFLQQRMMQMQRQQFLMNLMKTQSEVGKNESDIQWNQRRPLVTRSAPAIKGTDAQGNQVYKTQNPQTGDWETLPGVTPEGPTPDMAAQPTDKGIVLYDRHGVQKGAVPLTIGAGSAPAASTESGSEPSEDAAGSVLSSPGAIAAMGSSLPRSLAGGGQANGNSRPSRPVPSATPSTAPASSTSAPLMPFSKPTNQSPDEQTFNSLVASGLTPAQATARLAALKATAGEDAKNNEPLTGKAYAKAQNDLQEKLSKQFGVSEKTRLAAIADLNKQKAATDASGKPVLSPDEYQQKLQQIELDNADRKQQIHQQYADEASAAGVNLGTVPDYRAQLGAKQNPPATAKGGQSAAKMVGPDVVQAWASKQGIDYKSALKQFKQRGYQVGAQ